MVVGNKTLFIQNSSVQTQEVDMLYWLGLVD